MRISQIVGYIQGYHYEDKYPRIIAAFVGKGALFSGRWCVSCKGDRITACTWWFLFLKDITQIILYTCRSTTRGDSIF